MSMPPIRANAWMVVSASSKLASVRSISTPPIIANEVKVGGTVQTPLRSVPDMIAIAVEEVPRPPTRLTGDGAGRGIATARDWSPIGRAPGVRPPGADRLWGQA